MWEGSRNGASTGHESPSDPPITPCDAGMRDPSHSLNEIDMTYEEFKVKTYELFKESEHMPHLALRMTDMHKVQIVTNIPKELLVGLLLAVIVKIEDVEPDPMPSNPKPELN
jgi:hypothetical protein